MPENYKELLASKLEETRRNDEGDRRTMWSNAEVQDMLLDLWNALNLDLAAQALTVPEPVLA